MTAKVNESISEFVTFFRDRFVEIEKISVLYSHQYQKVLFFSAVDTLARVYQPEKTNNRKRFTSFVEEFSSWSDGRRVSLPHLSRVLEVSTDPQFGNLRQFVTEALQGWKTGRVLPLTADPKLEQIKERWPESVRLDGPLKGLTAESLTHIELIYAYRNILIHEFRTPTADFTNTGPCYMYQTTLGSCGDPKRGGWILSYPVSFIKGVAFKCLEGLEAHLTKNQIDPYESFIFGDYWLDSLNSD